MTPEAATVNRADPLATKLAALRRFYSHKDVLDDVFGGDEDAFIDAWVTGQLPLAVRQVVWEGGAQWLNTLLLARLCRLQLQTLRQQADLVTAQAALLAAIDKLNAPWEAPPEGLTQP